MTGRVYLDVHAAAGRTLVCQKRLPCARIQTQVGALRIRIFDSKPPFHDQKASVGRHAGLLNCNIEVGVLEQRLPRILPEEVANPCYARVRLWGVLTEGADGPVAGLRAKEQQLPIIIHSRDADDDTVDILRQEYGPTNADEGVGVPGIMHCFGGTPEMAKALMPLGFLISFAGNVTFKKAENLRDAARVVPFDKLLIETDCPFLTPIPHRGKRNEPAYVEHTARFLAEFYGITLEELAEQTTRNFLDFFKLDISKGDLKN